MLKFILLLLFVQPLLHSYILRRNNVCRNFDDYYRPDESKNCYYDPDISLETPAFIEKYAGIVEIHEVVTEDGYILTLFRIPRTSPRGVIVIHHSIATYSHIYLWQGNDSLALTLWHNGYDVWLSNQRGTSYSDRHVNMTSNDYKYWNFSFHELGFYDVSAEATYIRGKTRDAKLIYMGHSLGSVIGLVYAAIKSKEAENYFKCMILLAAPCYFEHMSTAITIFKVFSPALKSLVEFLHMGSPLIMLPFILQASKIVLRLFPGLLYITCVLVWTFCGYTPEETDPTFFNYDGTIYLNNFSWKTLLHFIQLTNTNHRFQMYDYGKTGNLKIYGSETPPLYPIHNISVPILLVSSYNDSLISLKDSESLYDELPRRAKIYEHWKIYGLNHLDYHLGLHRKEIFVNRLIRFLNQL